MYDAVWLLAVGRLHISQSHQLTLCLGYLWHDARHLASKLSESQCETDGLRQSSLQGVVWFHRLQAEIVQLYRSSDCLVILIPASSQFSAVKPKGTASQHAKCGIIPMIPPSIKDLRTILENLMSRCQMPAPISETNQEARDLLCDLCCGNYRIIVLMSTQV